MKGRKRKPPRKAGGVFNSDVDHPGRSGEARDSAGSFGSDVLSRSYLDGQLPGPMSAETVVAPAWERSDLSEAEALDLAYRELREARRS